MNLTLPEIAHNNEKLAIFMGWTKGRHDGFDSRFENDWFVPQDYEYPEGADFQLRNSLPLLFHAKWGWLMPVVRRIVEICTDPENGELFESEYYNSILDTIPIAVLEDAYKVVVEFVDYYNAQKS